MCEIGYKKDSFYTERKRKGGKMRSRSFSVIFLGMTLILFLAFQALGQAPIVYMFKAEFGMTPEELRTAYKEEEENHNNAYQQ